MGTDIDVRPYRILNFPFLPLKKKRLRRIRIRLIHPAAFRPRFLQNPFRFPLKFGNIHIRVVISGNKGCDRRQIIENRISPSPFDLRHIMFDPGLKVRFRMFAPVGCDAGHACSAKSVQNHIPRFGIVENVTHDCFVRYFCVISMRIINGVVFSFAHIRGKRFSVIYVRRFLILCSVFTDKLADKRIRARGIVRRLGEL